MEAHFCMEHVMFNKTYGFREWQNRELLFGISPELDQLITENFIIVGRLIPDSLVIECFGFDMMHSETMDQCFCCFFNHSKEKFTEFLQSNDYREYDRTIKEICKILGWKHNSARLLRIEKEDLNMADTSFDEYLSLWEQATPVLGS